jgi:hypothetical protein
MFINMKKNNLKQDACKAETKQEGDTSSEVNCTEQCQLSKDRERRSP